MTFYRTSRNLEFPTSAAGCPAARSLAVLNNKEFHKRCGQGWNLYHPRCLPHLLMPGGHDGAGVLSTGDINACSFRRPRSMGGSIFFRSLRVPASRMRILHWSANFGTVDTLDGATIGRNATRNPIQHPFKFIHMDKCWDFHPNNRPVT